LIKYFDDNNGVKVADIAGIWTMTAYVGWPRLLFTTTPDGLRPRLMVYFTTTPMVLLRPRLIVRSWRGHNMSILLGNLRLAFSEIPLQVIKFLCITLICLTSSDDSYLLLYVLL
jgi:hypothetical protein